MINMGRQLFGLGVLVQAIKPYYNLILALLPLSRVFINILMDLNVAMRHPAVANLPNGEHVNEFKNKYNITEGEQVWLCCRKPCK